MILDTLARPGEQQAIQHQSESDGESNYSKSEYQNRRFDVSTAKKHRHHQPKYGGSQTARSGNNFGGHSPQTLFFIRRKKLFDLRQNIFSDLLQFVSVFNLTDLFRYCAADLLASGHG